MSYNVSGWKVKALESFTLPLAELHRLSEAPPTLKPAGLVFDRFPVSGMEVIGNVNGDRLEVSSIYYTGEFSGHWWDTFEECLLDEATGLLRVLVVWEDGDTVEMLTVTNGEIEREDLG